MAEFGRFESVSAFLEAFKTKQKKLLAQEISATPAATIAETARIINKLQKQSRDIVEVNARLSKREPDDSNPSGGKHVLLLVSVRKIIKNDPDVATDVKDALATGRNVLVAIRVGDSQGILQPIKGLTAGADLHLKGEWITKEKAKAQGGQRMSVLHFTHHPVGFTCTPVKCYL